MGLQSVHGNLGCFTDYGNYRRVMHHSVFRFRRPESRVYLKSSIPIAMQSKIFFTVVPSVIHADRDETHPIFSGPL